MKNNNTLKDGDKLICIDPYEPLIFGKEYVFKGYYDNDEEARLISLYDFNQPFFEHRFNKVEETPIMELKDGDKLVCVKPRLDMKKGDIYTFKEKVKDKIDLIYVYEYPTSCFASRFEKLEENKIQKKREEFIILCGEYKLEGRYDCMDDCLQYLYTISPLISPLDVEIYKKVANVKTETKCKVEVV